MVIHAITMDDNFSWQIKNPFHIWWSELLLIRISHLCPDRKLDCFRMAAVSCMYPIATPLVMEQDYWITTIQYFMFYHGYRGSITSGWKEEESCTSEWFCVLGRGLLSPKTQNHSRVQDSSSFHPRVIEPVSPTIKRRNLNILPWS